MISIIKRDLLSTKRIKCTLSIISIYLIYFFVQNIFIKSLFKGGVEQVFARTIGITYDKMHFLDILIMILSLTYLIYITISIYLDDLSSGKEQILLRIDRKKYIITKLISIINYILIVNVILYFLLFTIIHFLGYKINIMFILKLFLTDFILKLIYSFISLIIYNFTNIIITILIFMIIPIGVLIHIPIKFLFAYQNINNLLILFIIFVVLFIGVNKILIFKIDNLFALEEKNEI